MTDQEADGEDKEPIEPARGAGFPIVGVGASAGGLEAFTQLLRALPADTGMGFVLVQHLDPDHESQLVQILARATSLPVQSIIDNQPVEPDHVYVIPRDAGLSIERGVLTLQPRRRDRTPHRPIDAFFESLARDQRDRAIGVVLSGTANDGTLGLEAIKAEGGITFAQDDSAKHDSMPRSAVAAGCVDLVLSPADIAMELARIAKHPYVAGQSPPGQPELDRAAATAHADDDSPLPSGGDGTPRTDAQQARSEAESGHGQDGHKKILLLLRNHSGVDFSLYKSTTIQRRIGRRVVLTKQEGLDGYAAFLRNNAHELDALYSDVLISVTSFFRNPEAFEVLQERVLPQLLAQDGDEPIRCWVLGCSTGQEAYSIAIAFAEAAEKAPRMRKLQIFATDLNEALLEKARAALYAKSLAEDISPERLRRFFVEEPGGYRVSKALREMVVFARQNVISDPPFSRMDLISCRNLLIYLEPSLQQRALPTFHYALKQGGFLLLGASETIGTFTELFEPVDKKHKIYAKKGAPAVALHLPIRPAVRGHGRTHSSAAVLTPEPLDAQRGELDAQREADRVTVHQFAPPGVLVNSELQVLQFRGSTGAFLEPPVGRASFDVLKMAREGLMLPLRNAVNEASNGGKTVRRENVRVERDGQVRTVTVEVIPLRNLRERCFLILFEEDERPAGERETPPPTRPEDGSRSARLETEVSEMREYVQALQEQHDAAHEEVQSANEEVQSANEELQSINEELETSKEELESANEELTTVNDEMSNRNVELTLVNNDLVNLQGSARLAVVLLGRDLTIRRFSVQAEKQLDLLATDLGRPIGQVRHGLVEAGPASAPLDIAALVKAVVADLREQECEVLDRAGRWHLLRVRPYITTDNRVDGAILVLVDVDSLKRSEQSVFAARDYAENLIDTVREPLLVLDPDLRVERANRSFYKTFRVAPPATIGQLIYDLGNRQWDIPRLREMLTEIVSRNATVEDYEVVFDFESLGRRTMLVNARRLQQPLSDRQQILLAIADVTDRRETENALHESETQYRTLVEQVRDYAIFRIDPRGRATTWNEGVERVLGFAREEFLDRDITETIFTPEDVRDGVPEKELEVAARTGSASNDRWMRRRDGSRFAARGVTTALRDVRGALAGFTKVMRDQTAAVQAEEALQNSHAEAVAAREAVDRLNETLRENEAQLRRYAGDLSDAAERKNEFLAMLGHELRNPLSALVHGLERQGMVLDDRERSEELRGMMMRQTRRITTQLDQLLDISRVISGKVELSKDRVALADVVRAAVESVKPVIESQKHELRLALLAEDAIVIGDSVRLTQVVENLLTNAAKYTNEGGRIEVSLETADDNARIAVRDNGIGMSADLLPHVFEVFTQAPRALDRAKGGLGLGLPIVERLVDLHGGSVTASSPGLGRGSEFVVTLPVVRGAPVRLPAAARPAIAADGPLLSRRILVVDDEPDIADALAELLHDDGHEVLAVHDGPSAIEAVRSFAPEVVLLDVGLPGLDGYEVARRIRDEHGQKIMLIAVTGYQGDAARLEQAGFDQHLIKPPNLRKLAVWLAAWDGAPT